MRSLLILLSGTSFVVGFFVFTWSRGCLHRARRILEENGEEVRPGKLEYSQIAAADPRLARKYRIGLTIWVVSSVAAAAFAVGAILL